MMSVEIVFLSVYQVHVRFSERAFDGDYIAQYGRDVVMRERHVWRSLVEKGYEELLPSFEQSRAEHSIA